jgi:hypothetical protein
VQLTINAVHALHPAQQQPVMHTSVRIGMDCMPRNKAKAEASGKKSELQTAEKEWLGAARDFDQAPQAIHVSYKPLSFV